MIFIRKCFYFIASKYSSDSMLEALRKFLFHFGEGSEIWKNRMVYTY